MADVTEPKGPSVSPASGQAPAASSASTIAVWPFSAAALSHIGNKQRCLPPGSVGT